MGITEALILAGGLLGGYVSGLTGFGTGIAALPLWLSVVHPTVAAPLVVVCSIVAQLQTLPAIWHTIDWRRAMPFIVGGVAGVPAGTVCLSYVTPHTFKLMFGGLVVMYCSFMLLSRSEPVVLWGGRIADAAVGLGGGVLGGLAGLSGPLPTVWASLRGWGKDAKRGVFQVFNLTVLLFAFVAQAIAEFVTYEVGVLALVALPGTLLGAWLGRKTYNRMGERQFGRVVLTVLLLSGISIVLSAALSG